MSNKHTVTVRNKFDTLQEISETLTPNDEYENFVNANMEAAVECIPTKPSHLQLEKKNEITRKQHPYLINETHQILTRRNLRRHKEN